MLPYESLRQLVLPDFRIAWTEYEVMLHAVAVGLGRDPADERGLPYVYERDLRVLPSFIAVLEKQSAPGRIAQMGIDLRHVLHGGQSIEIHAPIPPRGSLVGKPRIIEAYDKGDKGAIVFEEVAFHDEATDALIAVSASTMIVRNEGHFGGKVDKTPAPPAAPDRAPDHRLALAIRPEQAVLFRLLGDRNPLHIDPVAARRAGFDRPILHGMCTLGMVAGGVLAAIPDLESDDFCRYGANFASWVFPGEVLQLSIWHEEKQLFFAADAADRGTPVLRNGLIRLR